MHSSTEDEQGGISVPRKVKSIRSKRLLSFSRFKRRLFKHVWFIRLALLVGVIALFAGLLILLVLVLNSFGLGRYSKLASAFILAPGDKLEQIDNRTNILILGKGGDGHEAPDLTDTIMLASVDGDGGGLSLISVPRDIWIEELRAKINSAYYWGNQKSDGGGIVLSKATVESVLGVPIQYVVVVDFSDLSKVVDLLGGVEVNVENSFTDEHYPIAGREADLCGGDPTLACRYETIKFEKGVQSMDGTTALKFVRSRYAKGDEGTDFARAARQQKVIEGIQKKIMSRETYLSPKKISGLLNLFDQSVETDLSDEGFAVAARKLFDSGGKKQTYVLGEDLLDHPPISPKYDNLYVFVPKSGSWDEVHSWVEDILDQSR